MEFTHQEIEHHTNKIAIDPSKRGQLGERYMMTPPKIQLFHGKSAFVNLEEICTELHRPTALVAQVIAHALSCRSPQQKGGFYYFASAALTAEKALSIIDAFTAKYLLCPECTLAETSLVWHKSTLHLQCDACGCVDSVRDPSRKKSLQTFIEQHAKEFCSSKQQKKISPPASPADVLFAPAPAKQTSPEEDDDDWALDTSPAAVALRKQQL